VLRERYDLRVPPHIENPQKGDIVVGWYDLDGFAVLPTFDAQGTTTFSRIASARLAPVDWTPVLPPETGVDYGGALRLAPPDRAIEASPGKTLAVDLHWYALAPSPHDWQLFVHLVPKGKRTQPLVQIDEPLGTAAYPSSFWPVGENVSQRVEFSVPASVEPGAYDLLVGLYDLVTNERVPTPDSADSAPVWSTVEMR
jgi:hypothetical protein